MKSICNSTRYKKTILVLNYTRWNSLQRGVHQYCKRFAERFNVVYVPHPPDRKGIAKREHISPVPILKIIRAGLYELIWPFWCLNLYRGGKKIQSTLTKIRTDIAKYLIAHKELGPINFIYVTHPYMFPYLRYFPKETKIYHAFDQYSHYDGTENKAISTLEKQFLPDFDWVFCSSKKLVDEKRPINPMTSYLPNGVDYDLYSKARRDSTRIPQEFNSITQPVVGYVGLISGKIDFDVIRDLVRKRKDWSFVFVGPLQLSNRDSFLFDNLTKESNFFYLGYKPPYLLPNYLKSFRAGIMPYRLSGHVPWVFPLKLYEYMAAGIPSVASDLESIEAIEGVVYKAHSLAQWIFYLEKALEESDNVRLVRTRQEIAATNTWDHRVREFFNILKGSSTFHVDFSK